MDGSLANANDAEPVGVMDRLLWRDAQDLLARHVSDGHPVAVGRSSCVWCGQNWPCPPRRIAERAASAAFRPWNESWTTRHDLNSLRAVPTWRPDLSDRPPRHAARNSGPFD